MDEIKIVKMEIEGVKIIQLANPREKGGVIEIFRNEWTSEIDWKVFQINYLISPKRGVLRGLHYHLKQWDYWFLVSGKILVGLYDLRLSSSSSLKKGMMMELLGLGDKDRLGLLIPPGVAHGFYVLTNEATLVYLVNQFYDGSDERGLVWSDSTLGLNWGVKKPILSEKDTKNPFLKDILEQDLPK